jgi:hypothetical protein
MLAATYLVYFLANEFARLGSSVICPVACPGVPFR